jgi:hypothetical protein
MRLLAVGDQIVQATNPTPPTEEARTRDIFIVVNGVQVGPFGTDSATGAEIKQKANLSLDTDLFIKRGHDLIPVANSETIKIHKGEEFVDLPTTPVSPA